MLRTRAARTKGTAVTNTEMLGDYVIHYPLTDFAVALLAITRWP